MRGAKIISMSLYGNDPFYVKGAFENGECWREVYPEWRLRIYCERDHSAIPALRNLGVEIIEMDNRGGIHGMFWRFLAASDPFADAIIVRDVDSRLNVRERAAVDAWLKSEKAAHVMRDHPEHGVLMPGGTWGIRGGVVVDMAGKIARWGQWMNKRDDQDFLAWNVWPLIRGNCLQHGLHGEQFPPHPSYAGGFVGEPIAPR